MVDFVKRAKKRSCLNHRIIRLNYNKLICCLPASQMFRKTHSVLHISRIDAIALYAIVNIVIRAGQG